MSLNCLSYKQTKTEEKEMKLLMVLIILNLGLNLSLTLLSSGDKPSYLHTRFTNSESLR
jgi:hypothetical protein